MLGRRRRQLGVLQKHATVLCPFVLQLQIVRMAQDVRYGAQQGMTVDSRTRPSSPRVRVARDTLLTSNGLTNKLKQVATELTHQYRVTYARPQTLIPPEQVTVTAAKPGLTVRGTVMKIFRERP